MIVKVMYKYKYQVKITPRDKDKDDIKKLGGRWNAQKKVWYFTYTKSTTNRLDKFSKWIEKSTEV